MYLNLEVFNLSIFPLHFVTVVCVTPWIILKGYFNFRFDSSVRESFCYTGTHIT